jgi:AcrR family transcriptional regulator
LPRSSAREPDSAELTSRRRILDAAFDLMAEAGYSGTSVSMISRRSGLPPSSTYWHFGSKEGLLTAVVEDAARRWLEGVPRWNALSGSPRERVGAFFDAVAKAIIADPTPVRLLLLLPLERGDALDESSREVVQRVRHSASQGFRLIYRDIFGNEAAAGREAFAEFGLAVADGAIISLLVDPAADVRQHFRHLVTVLFAIGDEEGAPTRRSSTPGSDTPRPRKPRRTTSQPAVGGDGDSRQRILDAAFDLMAESGYSGTSISMICARSGLPPSSTYWHFSSKEGLLAAVVADAARRWLENLPRWNDIEGSPEQRLQVLLGAVAQSTITNPTPTRLLLLLALERGKSLDAESLATMRDIRRSAAQGFRLAFRELFGEESAEMRRRSESLARFALAVADGAAIAQVLDPAPDVRRIFDDLDTAFVAIGSQASQRTA